MEEESKRNHGGGIREEDSWRRHRGEGIMEEKSRRRNNGGGIIEESWRRNHGEGESGRRIFGGGTQEAPRKHPRATKEAPRRHPGGTQEGPSGQGRADRREVMRNRYFIVKTMVVDQSYI